MLKTATAQKLEKEESGRIRLSTVILDSKHPCLLINTQCMGREITETRFIIIIVKSQLIKLAQAIWAYNTTGWV